MGAFREPEVLDSTVNPSKQVEEEGQGKGEVRWREQDRKSRGRERGCTFSSDSIHLTQYISPRKSGLATLGLAWE